jgi:hypothetical protein
MRAILLVGLVLPVLTASPLFAIDFRVERLDEQPSLDGLSKEITGQLDPQGIRVIRGTKTTYCDIWFCKDLEVLPNFESSSERLYPFHQGQLIGVARFAREGSDFRDQDIPEGVYTMRFALQPMDGAHEGTSISRDFLLLLRAEDDESADDFEDEEELGFLSMDAAESSHPAMLALQAVEGKPSSPLAIRNNEEREWWLVTTVLNVKSKKATQQLPLDFVVVGAAEE